MLQDCQMQVSHMGDSFINGTGNIQSLFTNAYLSPGRVYLGIGNNCFIIFPSFFAHLDEPIFKLTDTFFWFSNAFT